ncbi:Rossmann-like and DUF2520 domain-containing protein [Undibacterium parvum]|uniref:DUF2520 domain-containing protein n=1 Tax=Undibacterium parvum TaxID=401471 RepID=A0A3Q9BPZ2_9BURK|nr:Rossmann-like and DUF2520 domain-containing protein [Undibacterium parvum]AZP11759.1 DUF2520 domain-containing protein [Undibacterium parvum]
MKSLTKSLNIIGAGKVGRVLGRQFSQHQVFHLGQVCNRSLASALDALQFIGAGEAISDMAQLQPADVTMLTVPDDQIQASCAALLELGLLLPGSVLFHCSGAKASTELAAASALGVQIASLHPVRSFADPAALAANFSGSICSIEGDAAALIILSTALNAIDAKVVEIQAENKLLYHAGSVFASNYLVTLMETALQAYQAAGIPRETALAMAQPLATLSLDNVFKLGTAAALTGPIARGDMQTVGLQQQVVERWDKTAGDLYQAFIPPTIELAARKKTL